MTAMGWRLCGCLCTLPGPCVPGEGGASTPTTGWSLCGCVCTLPGPFALGEKGAPTLSGVGLHLPSGSGPSRAPFMLPFLMPSAGEVQLSFSI